MKNVLPPVFELSAARLKAMLTAWVTPELPGFTHNGAYLWYGPWEDHCRRVIQVYPLKGASAIFQWGLCFDFLPVFDGSGRLRYQRTDRSVGLHLFCWPPNHWTQAPAQPPACRFSRFGRDPDDIKAQLLRAFYEAQTLFVPWFQSCRGLSGALTEARHQRTDPACRYNWPSPDYVAAFLFAANGNASAGANTLAEFWTRHGRSFPPSLYDKLQAKLTECAAFLP